MYILLNFIVVKGKFGKIVSKIFHDWVKDPSGDGLMYSFPFLDILFLTDQSRLLTQIFS